MLLVFPAINWLRTAQFGMSITTGWDRAAQRPSLSDAPSLPPQETLCFSARYLVGDEPARGGVLRGKGAGQPWGQGQLLGGDVELLQVPPEPKQDSARETTRKIKHIF